ncbi:coupling of ubiquitin conjugation to ER degradation protein 1 [Colletotrichum spaethianum]|uniref:Coupling of ubiquitin conjugation to ER degradation protein 1 n=1 Tax=Colletotrichum spaethianum TaxID=700344 RepID=A0AA37PAJ3_9PEZI|nr:coupling of ubiquitin conjugation to ER degradation protein 1 [Colletotrichum spaethianum]GKT48672.1 coupling of ubiquitin conjugation to ER degradation protein 1 [Colletotrichum spaethianum]
MANEQISLPYLVVILLVTAFVIRFLFFSPAPPPAPRQSAQSVLRTREAAVERIQQMFPQVDRRTILWDLQRNGGNIQATSERILAGRMETVSAWLPDSARPGWESCRDGGTSDGDAGNGFMAPARATCHDTGHHLAKRRLADYNTTPAAPITFQPPPPPGANNAAASSSAPAKAPEKPTQPDLITRYKLQDKIAAQERQQAEADAAAEREKASRGWSSNRDERQSLLQKRRDEMILAARRKMEAKIAAEKAAS